MKNNLIFLAAGLLAGVILFLDPFHIHPLDEALRGVGAPATSSTEEGDTLWTCGMHPNVIQEEPGICPICQMDLVPMTGEDGHRDHDHHDVPESNLYTCPMHPDILQEEPGECPICGMDLVPVEEKPIEDTADMADTRVCPLHPGITSDEPGRCHVCDTEMIQEGLPSASGEPMNRPAQEKRREDGATVTIDPSVVQKMNVTTERVGRCDMTRRIRTVGYVDYNQETMVTITTKVQGWIEEVFVDIAGQQIRKGDPLFRIYSPDLIQTQQELLSARAYVEKMRNAPADTRTRAEGLLTAARQRLRYWDIPDEEIASIEESGSVMRTLTVYAPMSGVVMKRLPGLDGMAVKPGMELIHLADLSTLWLDVELYEDQLALLHEGSRAEVTLTNIPDESISGTIRWIEPEINEKTRTATATLVIHNRRGAIRVGMYATVIFEPIIKKGALVVPASTVLRTGERDLVVIALGEGRFAPRHVVLGSASDGYVGILDGLSEGDTIVTSAQFLIDSESNLREAVQKLLSERRGSGRKNQAPPTHTGHNH